MREKVGVFLSARYGRRAEMRPHAAAIEAAGLEHASRWVWSEAVAPEEGEDARIGYANLADLSRAQVVIAFTDDVVGVGDDLWSAGAGGRSVEFGYALCAHKRIFLVGAPENVFHHHGSITRVRSFDEALALILQERGET